MFKNAIRLPFRLLGIPLYLDLTFLIILPLLAWIIGGQIGSLVEVAGLPIDPAPLTAGAMPWILGLIAALGLFVSVVIHELGHAVTGRLYGVETERITLWFLGGMAQFQDMPRQRGAEAVVAVAGPITSFGLAALGWVALQFTPPDLGALFFVLWYLTFMNVLLAVFNMLPALPLDGGRVLRSLLAMRMNRLRATQITASVSRFLAVAMGIFGLLGFNLFLILIAIFIYMAGTAETRHAMMGHMLDGIRVEDLMSAPVATVRPEMAVSDLMDRMFREAHLGYPVVNHADQLVGMITLEHLRQASGEGLVGQVMTPQVHTVEVGTDALQAFESMGRNDFGRLVIVDHGGRIVGILTQTDLLRALQVRMVGRTPQRQPAHG